MAFQSSYSNLQVNQELVSRIQSMVVNNIPVFDVNGKLIDSGVPVSSFTGGKQTLSYNIASLTANGQIMLNMAQGFVSQIRSSGNITGVIVTAQVGTYSAIGNSFTLDIREVATTNAGNATDVTSVSGTSKRTILLDSGGTAGARFNRVWKSVLSSGAVTGGNSLFITSSALSGTVTFNNLFVQIEISY
jgi:hypothetical protein